MKKLIFIIFLYILPFDIKAQHILSGNLVPNPSFEEYTQCPYNMSQIIFAQPWTDCLFGNGSSDYINSCTNSILLIGFLNEQTPRTGNGYASITLLENTYSNYREYIEVKLKMKLLPQKYCTDFYISLSKNSKYAVENIQAYFSNNEIFQNNNMNLISCNPQIINKNGIVSDTLNWVRIYGSFEANGDEEYITIGNFDSTNITIYNFFNLNGYRAYYFIDDVSVCECSFDINLGQDTTLCEGESIILNPNLPNATYTWQDSSHAASYEVKQPGTYWVRAYVAEYDVYSSDTIVITQGDYNYCNPLLTIPNVITPNGDGANDNFIIQNSESYNITLQIYNRWGRLIYENANYQNDFNCRECADGVYYYVIKAKSKRNGREKEYKGSLTVIF